MGKLREAVRKNNIQEVRDLLEGNKWFVKKYEPSQIDIEGTNLDYGNVLWFATSSNYFEIVELLLNAGANPEAGGRTAMSVAPCSDIRILKLLLKKTGKKIDDLIEGRTPLCIAITGHNFSAVRNILNEGANINGACRDGKTPLHHAVWHASANGHVDGVKDILKFLVKSGANVNQLDKEGMSPLDVAKKEYPKDWVISLLEAENVCVFERTKRAALVEDDPDAQFQLGWMYEKGLGTAVNILLALESYQKAAEKKHSEAFNQLKEKAIINNNISAQLILGDMYEKGLGVARSVEEALVWYRRAAEKGDKSAEQAVQRLQLSPVSNKSSVLQKTLVSSNRDAPNLSTTLNSLGNMRISFSISHNDLNYGKEIGRGGFGIVYYGTWKHSEVAIKKLLMANFSEAALEEFKQEASIMAGLRSQYIIQFFGVCLEPRNWALVMEYCPKGSLYNLLHSQAELDWNMRIQMAGDIGSGLAYLHSQSIIHRDLKSLNILVSEGLRAKVTDFGLSKIKNETASSQSGTPAGSLLWMAPELFIERGAKHTEKSDIYSYGVTLWEIASQKLPFSDAPSPHVATVWVAQGQREEIPANTPALLTKAITWCWEQKKEQRPPAEKVVEMLRQNMSQPVYLGNLFTKT